MGAAAEPERRKPLRLAFGRDRRLPNRADFQRVYENGQKAGGRYATVFCLRREQTEGGEADLPWRLGITASRKAARRAIDRNRGRRLLREYFRLHQARIASGWDIVANMKPGLARA